jgi:hypothetical protein
MPDAVARQCLAGVEVPTEEGIDGERHVLEHRCVLGWQEADIHAVAIVQRGRGIVVHLPKLRPQPDAAHEPVIGQDRGLQVHHLGAAGVVGLLEARKIIDLGHALPAAAMIRLHEEGVADLGADLLE